MFFFKKKYPTFSKKQHKNRIKSLNKEVIVKNVSKKKKVYLVHNNVLPKNFLIYIRKENKKFFKKKKIKLYFKLKINYIISSKNKNSRMGKGVGTFNRFAFFKKSNKVFIEVFNISNKRLNLILKSMHKRHSVKFKIH